VRLDAPKPDEELEPNDAEVDANPIDVGQTMRGTLARSDDVDRFRFGGAEGKYEVEVSGAEDVKVTLRAGDQVVKGRKGRVALKPGTIISVERADIVADGTRPLVRGVDEEYALSVRP
jgi:hypothetical protein